MHKNFPTWYREVEIEPDKARLTKRWGTVKSFAESLSTDDLANAVVFFVSQGRNAKDFGDLLTAYFTESDSLFPQKKNDAELKVLAGALLSHLIASKGEKSLFVSLGVESFCFMNPPGEHPLGDIIADALRYLPQAGRDSRSYDVRTPSLRKIDFSADIEKLGTPGMQLPEIQQILKQTAESLQDGWTSLKKAWNTGMKDRFNVLSEENALLWELQCKYSTKHDKPLSDLSCQLASLPMAEQLADATRIEPGPPSIRGMISELARSFKEGSDDAFTLVTMCLETCPNWRNSFSLEMGGNLAPLFPIHWALSKAQELQDAKALEKLIESTCACTNLKSEFPPAEWIYRFYQECLLFRVLGRLDHQEA